MSNTDRITEIKQLLATGNLNIMESTALQDELRQLNGAEDAAKESREACNLEEGCLTCSA